jgi:(1->4)-alpha-D-glucan 1-alpha-D-glucosylmutase
MSDVDRRTVEAALETAADWGRPRTAAVQFVKRALLLDTDNPALRRAFVDFVRDLQQYSGAAMAKALEDTAMYRMNRLVSLNEVGGEMDVHEDPVAAFHKSCRKTAADHPLTMTTTSTHDTKRSEDVRSRLNTLSELAGEWK